MNDFIKIYDIGVNQVHRSDTFLVNRPEGLDKWMFLVLKSKAVFRINGEEMIFQPDTALFFKPFSPQYYCGLKGMENYCDHWMEFDIDENILANMGIPLLTPITGFNVKSIDSVMGLLMDEFYFGGEKKDLYIQMYMQLILEKLAEVVHNVPEQQDVIKELRREVMIHPEREWNVAETAGMINYSESHFQRVYKNTFGIAFNADVIRSRIFRAKTLLSETDMSVSQVALACGYNSDNYFDRQFKKMTGITPSEYRRIRDSENT